MASNYINIPTLSWRPPVASFAALPALNNNIGDAIVTDDTFSIYIWNGTSWQTTSGAGTVTSVGLSLPVSVFVVTGSPVTGSGTLTGSFQNQSANTVFAGPSSGAAAPPTFRALVSADLPAGTGTVTSVAASTNTVSGLTVTGSPITTSGTLAFTLAQATTSTNGYLSSTDWNTFNNKQPAGSYVTSVTATAPITSTGGTTPNIALTTPLAISFGGTNNSSAYTSGSVIFSNGTSLTQDNSNFFWNDTNFSLGIGTNTPSSAAFIDAVNVSGATKRILVTGYGTASLVGFRGRLARGTVGTPTAVQTGDILSFFNAEGYGTSQFPASGTGALTFIAGENFTNTSNLTYATINATATGSVSSAEAFRVAATGVTLGPQSSSTAVHSVNGGVQGTVRTVTASFTVDTTTTDYLILCNQLAAITVTLPAPTSGRTLIIKDISGAANTNNITIARHGTESIEGLAASKILQTNWGSFTIVSDGTNWFIV